MQKGGLLVFQRIPEFGLHANPLSLFGLLRQFLTILQSVLPQSEPLVCLFCLVSPNQNKELRLLYALPKRVLQHLSSATIPSDYLHLEKWNKQ